jgi:hypothetical protein
MPCTAFRSASPRTRRWSGCRSAAGPPPSCSTCSAAPTAPPGCSSPPGSRAPRPPRPPGSPTGRRCTPVSSGWAWPTPSARPARPRCSSARWRRGPAAGRVTGGRCRPQGWRWPPSGPTSAGTLRCGSAREPATPNRSATCPGSAGTTCAACASCPTAARCGASSATCPCSCTGRGPRCTCCQTGARTSADPCTRDGSSLSGVPPASPARGTAPPSWLPTAPSFTGPPRPASHPSRPG